MVGDYLLLLTGPRRGRQWVLRPNTERTMFHREVTSRGKLRASWRSSERPRAWPERREFSRKWEYILWRVESGDSTQCHWTRGEWEEEGDREGSRAFQEGTQHRKCGRHFLCTSSCFPPIRRLLFEGASLPSSQKSATAPTCHRWTGFKEAAGFLFTEEETEGGPGKGQAWGSGQLRCVSGTRPKGPGHKHLLWFPAGIPAEYSNFLLSPGSSTLPFPSLAPPPPTPASSAPPHPHPLTPSGGVILPLRGPASPAGPSRSVSNFTSTESVQALLCRELRGFYGP